MSLHCAECVLSPRLRWQVNRALHIESRASRDQDARALKLDVELAAARRKLLRVQLACRCLRPRLLLFAEARRESLAPEWRERRVSGAGDGIFWQPDRRREEPVLRLNFIRKAELSTVRSRLYGRLQ